MEIDIDEERKQEAVKTLKSWRARINNILESDFDDYIEEAGEVHPEGERMIKYLKDYVLRGGKRLRPAFLIAGYKAVGDEKDEIFSTSLSIEAMQNYFLIHDDIMDQDDLRRGKSTLHKMYRDLHEEKGFKKDSQRFGENMAIIAGNLINALGVEKIANSNFPLERKIEVIKKYQSILIRTGYGQGLDVTFNFMDVDDVEESNTDRVYELKSAHYTVAGPLELGATLGEATEEQKQSLIEYGIKVGMGFQLADDLLVLYGDEDKLGKKIGTDLEEGNKTIPILKAYEKGNKEQKEKIKNLMFKENVTEEEVEYIRNIVKETGSYDYCMEKSEKLIKEGKEVIRKADDLEEDIKDFLLGMADYIVTREL